jgi:hypothetical protein
VKNGFCAGTRTLFCCIVCSRMLYGQFFFPQSEFRGTHMHLSTPLKSVFFDSPR